MVAGIIVIGLICGMFVLLCYALADNSRIELTEEDLADMKDMKEQHPWK